MMRVVLDANVLISAVISSKGSPATILSYWREDRLELILSEAILQEVDRVMHHPRIQERYRLSEELIEQFLLLLREGGILVEPEEEVDAVEADASDNRYLECALAGHSTYVVSGDRHLLDLREYRGIQILAPREFVAFLKLEGM